jgi:hypothetical protein
MTKHDDMMDTISCGVGRINRKPFERDLFLELIQGVAEIQIQRLYDTGAYKDLPKPRIARATFVEGWKCYSGTKPAGTFALGIGPTVEQAYADWLDVINRGWRRDLP